MLEHSQDRFPEQAQILLRELGGFREISADESASDVEAIRDKRLAPHGTEFVLWLLGFPLFKIFNGRGAFDVFGHCPTSNRKVER